LSSQCVANLRYLHRRAQPSNHPEIVVDTFFAPKNVKVDLMHLLHGHCGDKVVDIESRPVLGFREIFSAVGRHIHRIDRVKLDLPTAAEIVKVLFVMEGVVIT